MGKYTKRVVVYERRCNDLDKIIPEVSNCCKQYGKTRIEVKVFVYGELKMVFQRDFYGDIVNIVEVPAWFRHIESDCEAELRDWGQCHDGYKVKISEEVCNATFAEMGQLVK